MDLEGLKKRGVVFSIGGNLLVRRGGTGRVEEQFAETEAACRGASGLITSGAPVVVTHGNGPVVGNIVLRGEAAREKVPPMPLYISDADSEGGVGFMIQETLYNLLAKASRETGAGPREVAAVVTQVVVDPEDPAFDNPAKPIGPWYSRDEAEAVKRERGWAVAESAGGEDRGWRRVVPSPRPVRVVEAGVIERLFRAGVVVIAAGGGGVPVTEAEDGTLEGADAVVDKDLASSLLARVLGAGLFINLTGVDRVCLDYGGPDEKPIDTMTAAEAEGHMAGGHFPPGSMGPKVASAIEFLRCGGGAALITSPRALPGALDSGGAAGGTWITPG